MLACINHPELKNQKKKAVTQASNGQDKMDAEPQPKKRKVEPFPGAIHILLLTDELQVQECQKAIWLLTYASGSPDITSDMLSAAGVACIECYTITWRESKYTLIHLGRGRKMRCTAWVKVMSKLDSQHSIKGSHITGYETITCNSKASTSINDHPGFQRILQLLNSDRSNIRAWMQFGDIGTNKKGLLWKFDQIDDPNLMTRAQLIDRLSRLPGLTTTHKDLQAAHEALNAAFATQSGELLKAHQDLQNERNQSDTFFHQLCAALQENGKLKSRLVRLGDQETINEASH